MVAGRGGCITHRQAAITPFQTNSKRQSDERAIASAEEMPQARR